MAASPPLPKIERDTAERRVVGIVEQLLAELESGVGREALRAKGSGAHLEKDLGLGSLERVELLVRLDAAFHVHLPDKVLAEAETVGNLVSAIAATATNGAAPVVTEPNLAGGNRAAHAPLSPVHAASRRELSLAQSLVEILVQRGREEPDTVHITLYEDDERTRTITYGDLLSRAERVAAALTQRGLRRGDTVALMLPTGAEFFFCFAGIWLAGGIPVPMYPPFRADRIEEFALRQAAILRNAETRFLIVFRQISSLAKLLSTRIPSLKAVLDATSLVESNVGDAPPETEIRPVNKNSYISRGEDIAFLQYTSGSTGDPKGVILTHANLLANIRAIGSAVELRGDDVAVSWLPLYHDMGLIGAWFVPLSFGVPLFLMSPIAFLTRPVRWLRAISTHRGTLSPAPNFAYELCTRKIDDRDLVGIDLSSWRAALNGAEPVRVETLQRFADRFAAYGFHAGAFFPVYGLAEASLCVSAPQVGSGCKVDHVERQTFETEGRAIPALKGAASLDFVSAGKPIGNVEVKIVGPDGKDLPERIQGHLWFRGASATQGYYRNPEATAALQRRPPEAGTVSEDTLADGAVPEEVSPDEVVPEKVWLDSGDLAYRSQGDLYITGRAKDMIIKAGRNLYPHEMEEIAGRTAGVRTGCVVAFGAPDPKSGTERFVIAAETRAIAGNGEPSRIIAEIRRSITEAAGIPPDQIVLVGPHSIPKTSSGKLRRSEARRLFLAGELGRKRAPWLQITRLSARGLPSRLAQVLRRAAASTIEFCYGIYALGVTAFFVGICWLLLLLIPNRRFAASVERASARALLFCAGIQVVLAGDTQLLENTKKSVARIFAANHSSYADIIALTAILPAGTRLVAKGETLRMPVVRTLIRRAGHFAFDRRDAQARIRQADDVQHSLRRGESIAIFPEGTFTALPGIRPFQLGTFKSAVETHTPVCPVAVSGARQVLRDKTWLPRHAPIHVTVGPLVHPALDALHHTPTGTRAPSPAAPSTPPTTASPLPGAPPSDTSWKEIVRVRDAVREIIAHNTGEPLL